jgi:hypothetical protein
MRSPSRHELARGIWGHSPQEIFKIRVPEIAFTAFWEHIKKNLSFSKHRQLNLARVSIVMYITVKICHKI